MTIGIVDYGAGNLHSVHKALTFLGKKCRLVPEPEALAGVTHLVLPGVGSFGYAARALRRSGWWDFISIWLQSDKPFLGICLGMQLLFEGSEESPGIQGLGIFKGTCRGFKTRKTPQIGWNTTRLNKPSCLFKDITVPSHFYFVHGYFVETEVSECVLANTEYGVIYPSVVGRGRVFGTQFHPEKSGRKGLQLLRNWEELC
jgi:imidazole glycerol phosphate synthase glutamine amidotransferase subunit